MGKIIIFGTKTLKGPKWRVKHVVTPSNVCTIGALTQGYNRIIPLLVYTCTKINFQANNKEIGIEIALRVTGDKYEAWPC